MGISQDITQQKHLNEKLRLEHKNLEKEVKKSTAELKLSNIYNRSLIETSLDPLVTIGTDGKITDVNKAAENVTGYNRNELIGTDFSNYFTEPERASKVYEKVFKNGLVFNYPLEIKNKNGHITPVLYNASTYNGEFGMGVFAAARDITQIKQAENDLKAYQKDLEKKVQQRTEQLSKYNIKLKRSNEELERFAYVSSHDLQEPLRMITLYSQLLEKRYKDSLDSDADDFINYIVENAKRMKQLIEDLLEYSRLTSQTKEFDNVDLENILEQVLNNLSISITENNVKIAHEPLPTIFADDNQMMQVFQNLITNAIKFRGKKSPEINITARNDGENWIFAFKDNGIGIKPDHQKQIFKVFNRLHTKEEYSSTGIGLSIVEKIIKHHHGQIWVESELGKGSTFYFTVPLKESSNIDL
ncbi:MAG: PAS domain S-box protein [Methanobacterium sp.]|nr:PAS domain S-box protein [Methanobacterium sp.]